MLFVALKLSPCEKYIVLCLDRQDKRYLHAHFYKKMRLELNNYSNSIVRMST